MATVNKVIVTNDSALTKKYSSGAAKIKTAVKALIAADKLRGLNTILVELDNPADMGPLKAPVVTTISSEKQNKAAIDGVYQTLVPDYLLILGSIDVIPHQDLDNPIEGDEDPNVPSDLPYACEQPFSRQISKFLGPTRVVGRLPDITGGTDAGYLVGLLKTAAGYQSLPDTAYAKYLGISAKVWKDSTAMSLEKVFGNSTSLNTSPAARHTWPAALLGSRSHFINCHGSAGSPKFFGQNGDNFPVAHDSTFIHGKLIAGTLCAPECCYGAELYNATALATPPSICNTYLENEAYGYFGSSTIAYGPEAGNDQADLITQWFLKHAIRGASTGRAALQARQDYVLKTAILDPVDLKTLAQFNLMGDPAVHPVISSAPQNVLAKSKNAAKGASAKRKLEFRAQAATRSTRRDSLFKNGLAIAAAANFVKPLAKALAGVVAQQLKLHLRQIADGQATKVVQMETFPVFAPKAMLPKSVKRGTPALAVPDKIHLAVAKLTNAANKAPFNRYIALVAYEENGVLTTREYVSR